MIDLKTTSELFAGETCVASVAGELDMSTAPRFSIRKVFEITGLDTLFTIHPSRAVAMSRSTCPRT